ncbi:MAG: hypothetical protein KatS3mg055_0125 [Chloroflexus sp.]|nr:MAG: hypothetical protein KatS3mg055_0125 [Chloroflexus sp.]
MLLDAGGRHRIALLSIELLYFELLWKRLYPMRQLFVKQ